MLAAEVWNEFFLDDTDSRREIFVEESDVEFGRVPDVGVGDYRCVGVCTVVLVKRVN